MGLALALVDAADALALRETLLLAGLFGAGLFGAGEPAGELGTEVTAPLLADTLVEPVVGGAEPPETDAGVLRQSVFEPAFGVKAAELAVLPALSERVRPTEVPAGTFTFHVRKVPFCWPKSSMAAAPGWLPGRSLRK